MNHGKKIPDLQPFDGPGEYGENLGRCILHQVVGDLGQGFGCGLRAAGGVFSVASLDRVQNRRLGPKGEAGKSRGPHVFGRGWTGGVAGQAFGIGWTTHPEIGIDRPPEEGFAFQIGPVEDLRQGGQGIGNGKVVMDGSGRFRDQVEILILEKGRDSGVSVPAQGKDGGQTDRGMR